MKKKGMVMLSKYRKFCSVAEKIMTYMVGYLLILIAILTFANVVARPVSSIFQSSLLWIDESTRYMLVWSTFIVGAVGVRSQSHTAVDILPAFIKKKNPKFDYTIVINVFILICMLLFLYYCSQMVLESIQIGNVTLVLYIPMSIMYASTIFCGLFSTLFCIENILVAKFANGESNHDENKGELS